MPDLNTTIFEEKHDAHIVEHNRRAPWLLSDYHSETWVVCDSANANKTVVIDFRYAMPGGKNLLQFDRLYATVKEYCWWVRDVSISTVDDCIVHYACSRSIMALAHRLALDGITSFSNLTPYDVDRIVEDARYGNDKLLRVSDRVASKLQGFVESKRSDGGDPIAHLRASASLPDTELVSRNALMASFDIPTGNGRGAVKRLLDRHAPELGIAGGGVGKTEQVPNGVVSSHSLLRQIRPLEHLYAMRRLTFADTIDYSPFPLGAARVAAVKGTGTSRTPTPAPRLALALVEAAARVVVDFDPHSGSRKYLSDVATACWIIVAAFSARRYEEIASLDTDCVHGDDKSGHWLRIYIAKTAQSEEFIPIPVLVVRAVNTMLALNAGIRSKAPGETRLFVKMLDDGRVISFDPAKRLDVFAKRQGVSNPSPHTDDDGNVWHWHPHQFRRFFAMLFFYRFDGASLEALAHHLRHFDLNMARTYVTRDPESAAIWMDVEWQHLSDISRRIVSGSVQTAGAVSDRLKKAYRRIGDMMRKRLRVQTPDRAIATLRVVMQREGLVVTPKAWVDCFCPNTAKAALLAACRKGTDAVEGAIGPDFSAAGPTVCGSGCYWALLSKKTLGALEVEQSDLEAATAPANHLVGVFKEWADARLVDVRAITDGLKSKLEK